MAESDFQARQKALGAVLTQEVADSIRTIEFDPEGYPVVPSFEPIGDPAEAVHFGNARKEYEAAKSKAVVFDLSRRGHLEFVGADRQKFLNGFCTGDVLSLGPGEGCEAFLPSIKGKVLGHVFVFAGENSLWLETTADSVQPLMNHLARYVISEDVDFLPRSGEMAELSVSGPQAVETLGALGIEVSDLALFGHKKAKLAESAIHVRRVDWLDAPGFLLMLPRENLVESWGALVEGGIPPAGIAVFHALRIQARFPLYGIDITEDNLAQEVARTEQAINFKKGCYLGQEPIARIDALGHVNRELRAIKLEAAHAPTLGGRVTNASGKEVGKVTSYAMLPDEHVPVALAYLHRQSLEPGTELLVHCEGEDVPAKVL